MNYDPVMCGKRIREERAKKNLTQEQLAEKVHTYDKHISRIENGHAVGSIDLIVELSSVFCVSVDYLLLGRTKSNHIVKNRLDEAIEILMKVRENL